jgi:N-acyl-L-homoserine lactone synthetase
MGFVSGSYTKLKPVYLERIARYRYDVFVERLGWKLQTLPGCELDQFDHEDAHYLTVEQDNGEIKGCARLLPTLRPYLLSEIFSPLLGEHPAPARKDVWELSRFAALDLNAPTPCKQMNDECAIDLLRAAMTYARSFGVTRLISVSPVGVGRLLKRGGIRYEMLTPPKILNNQKLVACSMLL